MEECCSSSCILSVDRAPQPAPSLPAPEGTPAHTDMVGERGEVGGREGGEVGGREGGEMGGREGGR